MSVEEELRKIDLIRERTRLGYEQARELLSEAGGDVVAALILWERRRAGGPAGVRAEEAWEKVRELIRRGNRTMLRVRRGDQTYLEMPLTAGVVAAVLAPYLAAAGAAACVLFGCAVSLERRDGADKAAARAPDGAAGAA